jgi:predicted transcriptional regulator
MPDLSVDQTIKIMNNEGFDQLPVIDELGWVSTFLRTLIR